MTTAQKIHEALAWPYDLDNDYGTDYLLLKLQLIKKQYETAEILVKTINGEAWSALFSNGLTSIEDYYFRASPGTTPRQALQNLTLALIEAGVLQKGM